MRILYINDIPVGCLTADTLSETIAFIQTCKTTEKGAIKSLGTLHAYSIPFEAVYVKDLALFTYNDLQDKGRNREIMEWSIIDDETTEGDSGQAFLENLSLSASTEDFLKFTGTLTGYGEIVEYNAIQNVWYQAVDTYVDNGGNYVFVN
jgi:hypothetical protein